MKTLAIWAPFVFATVASAWYGLNLNPYSSMAILLSNSFTWWVWPISGALGTLILWYFIPSRWLITTVWLFAFTKDEQYFGFELPQVIFAGAFFVSWLAFVAVLFTAD